jgi:hypothetical protein
VILLVEGCAMVEHVRHVRTTGDECAGVRRQRKLRSSPFAKVAIEMRPIRHWRPKVSLCLR